MVINIEWQGPLSKEEATELTDPRDFGIYQFYGRHPVYGANTLLYIGKARDQTLGRRISQQNFDNFVCHTAAVFVGRLAYHEVQPDEWKERIGIAEALLIYAHSPAWNAQNLNDYTHIDNLQILNWGDYGMLLPEVSTARYFYPHNRLPDHLTIYTDN